MTIKQALKRKKKLIEEISTAWTRVSAYNSVREGSHVPYDPIETLAKWQSLIEELIDLKTKLHKANLKVYDKIFRLSELKSQAKFLRSLNCAEGVVAPNRWDSTEAASFVAAISVLDRDKKVEEIEKQIEELQEELDVHNAKTKI
jgi:hypothetical protein